MTNSAKAWFSLVSLSIIMVFVIFAAAGTMAYWQAWLFLTIFFSISILMTRYLIKNDPALLKRRLSAGPTAEKEKKQKIIMWFLSVGFILLLIVPGLDYRFGWSQVPPMLVIFGDVLMIVGFYIVFLVYKVNTYTSATIEISKGQKVISTGPYAIVRHPMYAGSMLWSFGLPLALGSYWGMLVIAAMVPLFIWRLLEEEKFLANNLSGYTRYQKKVRSRLIPGIY